MAANRLVLLGIAATAALALAWGVLNRREADARSGSGDRDGVAPAVVGSDESASGIPDLERPTEAPLAPAAEDQPASRIGAEVRPERIAFEQKYAGLPVLELRSIASALAKRIQALATGISERKFAAGEYETRPWVQGEMVMSEGAESVTSRTHTVNGVRVVDIVRWLPSDHPEIESLNAELNWVNWKIRSFSDPLEQQPPNVDPAK